MPYVHYVYGQQLLHRMQKNKKETVTFFVEEMDCQNCIKKIEKGIAFEKGVTDLRCDLSTRTAKVTYKTDKTDCEKLCSAFKKIGLDVVPLEENSDRPAEKKHDHGHAH